MGRWVKKMLPPPRHTQHCLACRSQVFGGGEIARSFAHRWTSVLPRILILSQSLQICCGQKIGPVFIGRILRAVVLWWNFLASRDLF